eukprot:179797-Prorocentrum_minimum.AAC.2
MAQVVLELLIECAIHVGSTMARLGKYLKYGETPSLRAPSARGSIKRKAGSGWYKAQAGATREHPATYTCYTENTSPSHVSRKTTFKNNIH